MKYYVVAILFFSTAFLLNASEEIKKKAVNIMENEKEKAENQIIEKMNTLTGVVKSVDIEKKLITVDSIKIKGESITFNFQDIKVKDGESVIDASSLKPGDKIKIKYKGDIKSPQIEKIMKIKGDLKSPLKSQIKQETQIKK